MFHPPTPRAVARHRFGAPIVGALLLAMASSPVPASGTGIRDERPVPVRHAALGGRDGVFDSRRVSSAAASSAAVPSARVLNARVQLSRQLGNQGIMAIDPLTHTPRMVAKLDGFLTGTSAHSARSIALSFVRANLTAFGLTPKDLTTLRFDRDYVDIDGGHHVSWVQGSGSLIEFDNGLKANVTADGRLINVSGSPVHGLRTSGARPVVTASTAFTAARRAGGARVTTASSQDQASLVLFHTGRGTRLAWRTTTFIDPDQIDLSVVDARTGAVLWRANQVRADTGDRAARGSPTRRTRSAERHAERRVVRRLQHDEADGQLRPRLLRRERRRPADRGRRDPREQPRGIRVELPLRPSVHDERRQPELLDGPHECTWDRRTKGSWTTNRKQNAVQLFYYLNKYHDHLRARRSASPRPPATSSRRTRPARAPAATPCRARSWTERTPTAGCPDAVPLQQREHVHAARRPEADHADVSVPPGFEPARLPVGERRGRRHNRLPRIHARALEPSHHLPQRHERAQHVAVRRHGRGVERLVRARLHGEPGLPGGRGGRGRRAGRPGDHGRRRDPLRGGGLSGQFGAPGRTNCKGHARSGPGGFTYGDFGKIFGRPEVHSDGEIWLQTLWQLRDALRCQGGRAGEEETECLVTRAMELSPPDPSFLDMRNAILQADLSACG